MSTSNQPVTTTKKQTTLTVPSQRVSGSAGQQKPAFKVILLGDEHCGKSSLFLRLREDIFTQDLRYLPQRRSNDYYKKYIKTGSLSVEFTIWDTAGGERYDSLTMNYYRSSHVAMLVFDLTNFNSLNRLTYWAKNAQTYAETALLFLVGTKSDVSQEDATAVTQEQMQQFCDTHQIHSMFCVSSKTGEGVDEMCENIANTLVNLYQRKRDSIQYNMTERNRVSVTAENKIGTRCGCQS